MMKVWGPPDDVLAYSAHFPQLDIDIRAGESYVVLDTGTGVNEWKGHLYIRPSQL